MSGRMRVHSVRSHNVISFAIPWHSFRLFSMHDGVPASHSTNRFTHALCYLWLSRNFSLVHFTLCRFAEALLDRAQPMPTHGECARVRPCRCCSIEIVVAQMNKTKLNEQKYYISYMRRMCIDPLCWALVSASAYMQNTVITRTHNSAEQPDQYLGWSDSKLGRGWMAWSLHPCASQN